jgi:hypothetical protein
MMMIYIITENGKRLPNDTITSVIKEMVDTNAISEPGCSFKSITHADAPNDILENINRQKDGFVIIRYDNCCSEWTKFNEKETNELITALSNPLYQQLSLNILLSILFNK